MRQILYLSKSTDSGEGADLDGILQQSRHNNAIDGITGLLWSDGTHFLQVFEGPEASVASTWARIQADTRHSDIVVVHDIRVGTPEFGDWTMAHRHAREPADQYDMRMRRLLARVAPATSEPFLAMISSEGIPD